MTVSLSFEEARLLSPGRLYEDGQLRSNVQAEVSMNHSFLDANKNDAGVGIRKEGV